MSELTLSVIQVLNSDVDYLWWLEGKEQVYRIIMGVVKNCSTIQWPKYSPMIIAFINPGTKDYLQHDCCLPGF